MTSSIDLHLHTTASDGADSPAELIPILKKNGIRIFSVTDHDAACGALETENLVPSEMHFIRGIEFTCLTAVDRCHILGYNYDPDCRTFHDILQKGRDLRRQKLELRAKLMDERFKIRLSSESMDKLRSMNAPGKPQIAFAMIDDGFTGRLIQDRFAEESDLDDPNPVKRRGRIKDLMIRHYINPLKTEDMRLAADEVIPAILASGGIPVWAHPLGGTGETKRTKDITLKQLNVLMKSGLLGLECHYSRYSAEETAWLTRLAKDRKLLISGGSDYHGANKAGVFPGHLNAENRTVAPGELTILSAFKEGF